MTWTLKTANAPTGGTSGKDVATLVYENDVALPDGSFETRSVRHQRTSGDSDTVWQAMMKREIAAGLAHLNSSVVSASDIMSKVNPAKG